jgi:hypothetical protein
MNHVKDEMLEPNLKMVFGEPILKMEGPGVYAWSGDVRKTVQANLTNFCRIPGKSQSILRLLCFTK